MDAMNLFSGKKPFSLKEFIEVEGPTYLYWLLQNDDYFPECCHVSSGLLYNYLKDRIPEAKIVTGSVMINGKSGTHSWIETSDDIIDFTYFQFLDFKGVPWPITKEILSNTCFRNLEFYPLNPIESRNTLGYYPGSIRKPKSSWNTTALSFNEYLVECASRGTKGFSLIPL
jgi:hypothetical protein